MDKRKKPVSKDVLRQQRKELYPAVPHGELSLQEAVKRMRALTRMTQPEFAGPIINTKTHPAEGYTILSRS